MAKARALRGTWTYITAGFNIRGRGESARVITANESKARPEGDRARDCDDSRALGRGAPDAWRWANMHAILCRKPKKSGKLLMRDWSMDGRDCFSGIRGWNCGVIASIVVILCQWRRWDDQRGNFIFAYKLINILEGAFIHLGGSLISGQFEFVKKFISS